VLIEGAGGLDVTDYRSDTGNELDFHDADLHPPAVSHTRFGESDVLIRSSSIGYATSRTPFRSRRPKLDAGLIGFASDLPQCLGAGPGLLMRKRLQPKPHRKRSSLF
jgi:hypothetical protein